jgi:hypothetical protein
MILDIAVAADGNGRDGEYPFINVEHMLMNKSRNDIEDPSTKSDQIYA